MRAHTVIAALCGLFLTAAGAAGAHLVAGAADAGTSAWTFPADRWNSALLYGFAHTLAGLIAARTLTPGVARTVAAWAFVAGVILFSGVQIVKLLWAGMAQTTIAAPGADPATPFDALTALVPVGGLSFMAGWIALSVAALMAPKSAP